MSVKKVFTVFFVTLIFLGVLASCSPTEPTSELPGSSDISKDGETNNASQKDITVQIFQSKVEITGQLEAMAKEYTELTGIKIEVLGASGDGYLDALMSKLTSGQGPTIMSIAPGVKAQNYKSYLYDLSDQPYISDIADNLALTIDGKIVGVPYGVEGYGMIYNKNLINPSHITNLKDFQNFALEMKSENVSSLQLSDKSYFLIGHILNIPFGLQKDTDKFIEELNAGKITLSETPEFKEWAKFMEIIRDTSDNPMGITYDEQIAKFAVGEASMIHQGNWAWGMFEDYDVEFDMGILPLPVMGNNKIAVGIPSAWCINKEADPQAIEAALDFFTWMFTSERGAQYITEEFNFIPALKSITAENLDPLSKTVSDYANSGDTLPWSYNYWPAGIIENNLFGAAQRFFSDENITGEQLLLDLDTAWTERTAAN